MKTPPFHLLRDLALSRKGMAPAAVLVASTLLISSCAQSDDGRTTQAQGTGIGALLGAGAGAILGNQSGHAGEGALIGAALGGAGGFAYGTHVANKKAKYKSTEEWLDACISDAEKKRGAAAAYNNKLSQRIASLQQEIRVAKASGNTSKLASLKHEISADKADAVKNRDIYEKEAQAQMGAIKQAGTEAPSKVRQLKVSANGIEAQAVGINKNVSRFAALENQIDV
jgi:uncharacterized protein YcfJ